MSRTGIKKMRMILFVLVFLLLEAYPFSSLVVGDEDYYLAVGAQCPTIQECGWQTPPDQHWNEYQSCFELHVGMQLQGDDLVVAQYRCSTIGEVFSSTEIGAVRGASHEHRTFC